MPPTSSRRRLDPLSVQVVALIFALAPAVVLRNLWAIGVWTAAEISEAAFGPELPLRPCLEALWAHSQPLLADY